MVCSNCHSREVIKVQDQFFCINCGQLVVSDTEGSGSEAPVSAVISAATKAPATKRRPGRPKSGPLDAPRKRRAKTPEHASAEASADPVSVNVRPRRMADIAAPTAALVMRTHASTTHFDAPVEVAAATTPGADAFDAPEAKTATSGRKGRVKAARVTDEPASRDSDDTANAPGNAEVPTTAATTGNEPDAPTDFIETVLTPADDESTHTAADERTASSAAPEHARHGSLPERHDGRIHARDFMAASVRDRFRPGHIWLALLPALAIAGLAGLATYGIVGIDPARYVELGNRGGLPLAAELLALAALYYVGRSLAHGAIIYGVARDDDHRPAPFGRWFDAAINSFGVRLRFDLLCLVIGWAVVLGIGSLLIAGGSPWGAAPLYAQAAALAIAFAVLVYLGTGLALAQGFGRVAVTLGHVSARHGFAVGWGFFRKHFDLAGAKLVMLLVELALLIPLVAIVTSLVLVVPTLESWVFALAAAVGALLAGASIGAGSAIWWQAAYRRLVRTDRLTEAVGLLTGRRPEPAHAANATGLTLMVIIIAGAASVIPWLPWPALASVVPGL